MEKKVKEKDKREKDKKERLEKQRLLGQRWAMKRWVTEFIRENEKNWELEKKEREKQNKSEIENWEKLKRKEKIKRLQEKWRKKDDYQEQKEEKIQSSENQNKEIWTWRKREREEGENDAELGGGGSPVAFPIPKKAPSSLKMEGDPPLGKERGALGVGTGPTPLPKRPFPPKDVIKRPKIVLEEQNISKIISNMPSVGKIITTATRVKNLTITTVSSEGQKATITKKKLRQVAKVSTDRKKHEVPSNQNIITTINKLDTKSISTANTEGQMAKITANIKPSNITKASDGEKMKKISIRNQDSKPQIENDYVIPEQQNTKVKTTLRPPQKEDNPKPKRNYNKEKMKKEKTKIEDNSLTKITTMFKPITTPTIKKKTTTSEKDDLLSGNAEDGLSSKKPKLVEPDICTSFSNSNFILEPATDLAKQRKENKKLSLVKLGEESCNPDNPSNADQSSVMSKLEKEADILL